MLHVILTGVVGGVVCFLLLKQFGGLGPAWDILASGLFAGAIGTGAAIYLGKSTWRQERVRETLQPYLTFNGTAREILTLYEQMLDLNQKGHYPVLVPPLHKQAGELISKLDRVEGVADGLETGDEVDRIKLVRSIKQDIRKLHDSFHELVVQRPEPAVHSDLRDTIESLRERIDSLQKKVKSELMSFLPKIPRRK